MSKIHLTLTGVFAGVSICAQRAEGDEGVHMMFAPLDNAEFRAKVCPACLKEYVGSYTADELVALPADHWVRQAAEKPADDAQGVLL